MATLVKNIERDFFLKALYDEKIPVIYLRDGVEYILFLEKPAGDEMFFLANQPIEKPRARDKIELTFNYHEKPIAFSVMIDHIRDREITAIAPEFLYKDLDRSYSRVNVPSQMQIQFTFHGDRYNLSFPKVSGYEAESLGDFYRSSNPGNLSGLIEQMAAWIKTYASGYKLVIFKEVKPSTTEERVISETGKALFLSSTRESLPRDDPYPRKRIITEDMFKRYLESTGIGISFVGSACARFIRAKADKGILSDAWVPILFHQYVVGCIHIWNSVKGKKPFDYTMLDTLYQFAKVLVHSLKENGYFEEGKIKNDPFQGKVIDISVSGLLFTSPPSDFTSALLPESKLQIKITIPDHCITTDAVIVRRFKAKSLNYYGCHFEGMKPDDLRCLFQAIYGKPLNDSGLKLLTEQA